MMPRLDLSNNRDLVGPLPDSFLGLKGLSALRLDGTQLCAPTDGAFQDWLRGVEDKTGVTYCAPSCADAHSHSYPS